MSISRSVALVWLAVAAVAGAAGEADETFRVETLADGIHLASPVADDPRFANSMVIELPDGLMVVDAQPTVTAARRLLATIGDRLDAPVRFLVFSHPHADAVGGAPAFPSEVVRLGSVATLRQLRDPQASFDAESASLAGEETRQRSVPTVAIGGTTVLTRPEGDVHLRPAGRAHSGGDLIVLVPDAGIAAVGDLASVTALPFSEEGSLSGWVTALGAMTRERPQKIVPLRGPVLSLAQLRERQHALAYLTNQIGAAFTVPVPAAGIADWVYAQESFADWFGDPAQAQSMRSLIEIGIQEKLAIRRKRGIID